MHDRSSAERVRSLVLQLVLVALVLLGGAMVYDAVSDATAPAAATIGTDG